MMELSCEAMARLKEFRRTLDGLWERRTAAMIAVVSPPKRGKQKDFNRRVRERSVQELLELAISILRSKKAKRELRKATTYRKRHHVRGHGIEQKGKNLVKFAERLRAPFVYSFWRNSRCLYVGRAEGRGRLKSYQRDFLLGESTSVRVFGTSRRELGKVECLVTHLHEPRRNRIKVASKKWGGACPVCTGHDEIRTELRAIFNLK